MIKNLIIKIILISILFSSLVSIYRQIIVIRSAQSSVLQLEEKMNKIEARNNALQQTLK
jgi:cell division protein FtsB